MIVDNGKEILAEHIRTTFTKVKIGNGGDDTAASQTALDSYVAETTAAPSRMGSQLVWTASFTGTDIGTQGVSELGIFNSSDTLLSRVTFTNTGVVPSTDTVTFTIRLEVD